MPNWCATNWALIGPEKEVGGFVNTVNGLRGRESVAPNGFGPLWLGNLGAAYGLSYCDRTFNMRGTVDPDPWAEATLAGPDSNTEDPFEMFPVGDGVFCVRFSTVSAWGVPMWLFAVVHKRYPSCRLEYRATDEFGNFHVRSKGWKWDVYEVGGTAFDCYESYDEGDEASFLEHLNRAGFCFEKDSLPRLAGGEDVVCGAVGEYNKKNRGNDICLSVFKVAEEKEICDEIRKALNLLEVLS